MKEPHVTIVIVHFNGYPVLKDCLDSLKKIDYRNYSVIVVDNASTDNSVEELRKLKFPNLQVIESNNNLGFAGGNNLALPHVKGEYLLLLNNDTTVSKDLLSVLVRKMEDDPTIGALQPKIKLMDTPSRLDNAGAFLNKLGLSVHWGFGEKDGKEFDEERDIFSAKGACLLTRTAIVQKVGLFDDSFGSYFEESDFCFRVWLQGYRVIYYPKTFIFHKVGFTSSQMDPVLVMLHSTKNRIASFYKNFNFLHLFTVLGPHILFLLALGFYYLVKLQFKKFWMIYGAIWWNIKNLGSLNSKRKIVQKQRKSPDSEFFPIIFLPIDIPKLIHHFRRVEENFKGV